MHIYLAYIFKLRIPTEELKFKGLKEFNLKVEFLKILLKCSPEVEVT